VTGAPSRPDFSTRRRAGCEQSGEVIKLEGGDDEEFAKRLTPEVEKLEVRTDRPLKLGLYIFCMLLGEECTPGRFTR